MKLRVHPREWGPLQRAAAFVAAAVVVGLGIWLGYSLWPSQCGDDLEEAGDECVGVTAHAFPVEDGKIGELVEKIAHENDKVREDYGSGSGRYSKSYVSVALTMPFTHDERSALTGPMIRRALAGALVAQREANRSEPQLQLLLAPNGKNLDKWEPVNKQLRELVKDEKTEKTPLVGVTGIPSSTQETLEAARGLSKHDLELPTIGSHMSSPTVSADYLFKTSPNNNEFVEALKAYLAQEPGSSNVEQVDRSFLVWDKAEDEYAQNLRTVLEKAFNKTWGLKSSGSRSALYSGITARGEATPQRFTAARTKICERSDADTIFFAGRDQDLPKFVERLAKDPCEEKRKLRILKVGTGFDPLFTTSEARDDLKRARATLVSASSWAPGWWHGRGEVPSGAADFRRGIEKLAKSDGLDLGDKPMDDGYAAMSYDGVQVLTNAVDVTYAEWEEQEPDKMPSKDDVFGTLQDSAIGGEKCSACLTGASGTYNFVGESHDKWSVCKPVPVLEFGLETKGHSGPKPVGSLYRTYQGSVDKGCPSDP